MACTTSCPDEIFSNSAVHITTDRIRTYIARRQSEGAANGSIDREPAAPAPSLPKQALTLQPRLMTNQLSSIRTSFVRALFTTDRAAEKSAIYDIIDTRFFEGEKGKFDVGLNCTTQRTSLAGLGRRLTDPLKRKAMLCVAAMASCSTSPRHREQQFRRRVSPWS